MKALEHRRHGVVAWTVAALAGASFASPWSDLPQAFAKDSREFSSEETAQLQAGKLVMRPEQRSVGGMRWLGGMSWQLVDADVSEVWAAMLDVRVYPKFLPAVEEARLIDVQGETRNLFIRHRLGFINASYYVRAVHEPAHKRIRFRLDRDKPSSIRDAWGELRVTPYSGERSVVSLVIMTDLGEGMIVGLVRSQAHEWMLRVPEQIKRYVEAHRT